MSLYTDLQVLIDETAAPVFWTASQLYRTLNEALVETWPRIPDLHIDKVTLSIPIDTDLLALDTTSIMIPQYLLNTSSEKIFSTRHANLEDWSRTWRNAPVGRPKWVVLWDWRTLRFFPRSDAAYDYTLAGVAWPPEISASNLDVTEDPILKQALVHRAASKLFCLTQPELAQHHELLSLEHEKRYARQRRNFGGVSHARLRPGVGWQVAQLGDIRTGSRYR